MTPVYTHKQLQEWADAAQAHMAAEAALFGIPDTAVKLPKITPAMVRSILSVANVEVADNSELPFDGRRIMPRDTRTHVIIDADEYRETVYRSLKQMSLDGIMPTMGQWDRNRPSVLPTAGAIVKRLGMTWIELAEAVDLVPPAASQLASLNVGGKKRAAVQRVVLIDNASQAATVETSETEVGAADTAPDFRAAR